MNPEEPESTNGEETFSPEQHFELPVEKLEALARAEPIGANRAPGSLSDSTGAKAEKEDEKNRISQTEACLIAAAVACYWHNQNNEAYATIDTNGKIENVALKTRLFSYQRR